MSEKQKKLRHGNGGDDTDHRGIDRACADFQDIDHRAYRNGL